MGQYKTIYADPPWKYADNKANSAAMGAATSAYPVMDLSDIKMLPVQELTDKDCTLLLWVTMPMLREGLEVIRAWGFTYKTCAFTWVKLNPSGVGIYSGMGHWVNGNAELVLLANQGHPKRLVKNIKQIVLEEEIEDNTLLSPRGKHSVKPEEVRRRIELLFEPPYIELFARKKVNNWACWGNEVLSNIHFTPYKEDIDALPQQSNPR